MYACLYVCICALCGGIHMCVMCVCARECGVYGVWVYDVCCTCMCVVWCMVYRCVVYGSSCVLVCVLNVCCIVSGIMWM